MKDFAEYLKAKILAKSPTTSFVTVTSFKTLQPGKDMNVKSRSTGLPLDKLIYRMTTVFAGCGNEYERAVNNRLTKEGTTPDFTKQERTWGERIGNSPVIAHKGKFYFEYNNLNANWDKSETKYYTTNSKRMLVELTKTEMEDLKTNFLPKPSTPKNQGTINPVLIRDVDMDTIVEFSGFGIDLKRTITI